MKIISLFNNKGGVGKTTLAYHLSYALSEMGHKVLMMDFDPQCNLSLYGLDAEKLHDIWDKEEPFMDSYEESRRSMTPEVYDIYCSQTHTTHFLLKPTEAGVDDFTILPTPVEISKSLALIPGRLTINQYESIVAKRWMDAYGNGELAIRTITKIREIAQEYAARQGYEFVILDTSPNLGILNKVLISIADAFMIPAFPDMFSLYGIKNIGNSLSLWAKEFDTMYKLISEKNRNKFPSNVVQFLGYTIYNAKRYENPTAKWNLAKAHLNYVEQIPSQIAQHIPVETRKCLSEEQIQEPIGGDAVMYSHNTYPSLSQKYHVPMWEIPNVSELEESEKMTISGNKERFFDTKNQYMHFASAFLDRVKLLDNL